jgi:hypothetical protein
MKGDHLFGGLNLRADEEFRKRFVAEDYCQIPGRP